MLFRSDQIQAGIDAGSFPPLLGIRIKPMSPLSRERALRTLRIFQESARQLPEGFVVTLPKVTTPEQIAELAGETPLPLEAMIETPGALRQLRAIVDAGKDAGKERCRGVHFGPYDYLSNLGIAGTARGLGHPACNFARSTMQVELADSGVWLSDGPTSTIPVPPKETMERAWRMHYANVRQALENGFYQGWDLHPAQFIARYAAVYTFLLEGLDEAATRLKNFSDEAGQATRIGATFDDAATAEGLLLYVKRAIEIGRAHV